MSIHQLNLYGMDKVQIAIQRLKAYEPPEGYHIAFSGGKDSCVIKAIADMAGVKYDAHYSVTGIDPPELCYFIKEHHPDVIWDIPRDRDGNRVTMWSLIVKKKIPPTHIARFCCEELKESQALGRLTVTGVRWAESSNRKRNQGEATIFDKKAKKTVTENFDPEDYTISDKGGVILRLDNRETAKIVEMCYKTHKTTINPIIDWTDDDVWEFIKEHNIPYCKLYDEGYKRLGCVGCPMARRRQKLELEKYPRFKRLYLLAFENMLKAREEKGLETRWQSPEDVMEWWTRDN